MAGQPGGEGRVRSWGNSEKKESLSHDVSLLITGPKESEGSRNMLPKNEGDLLLHLDEIGREGRGGEELKVPEILIGSVDGGMFLPRRDK